MTQYEISLMTDGSKLMVTEFYGSYVFQQKSFRSVLSAVKHVQQRVKLGSAIHPNCDALWMEWQAWADRCR